MLYKVPRHMYVGNSVMEFVADAPPADETVESPAASAVSALAQALVQLNAVALVRHVYSRVSAPVLGVLTPRYVFFIDALLTSDK